MEVNKINTGQWAYLIASFITFTVMLCCFYVNKNSKYMLSMLAVVVYVGWFTRTIENMIGYGKKNN